VSSSNPCIVNFYFALPRFASQIDYGPPEFMQHHPCGFVAPESKLALYEEGRNAALIGGQQVGSPKPNRQRRFRVMQDRPCGQRHIFTVDAKTFSTFDTPDDDVAWAVRCSCSIPGFFQPVNGRYVDGGVLSNLPSFVFSEGGEGKPLANRILAFTLVQKRTVSAPPTARGDLFRAIVNTVVDGASAIQGRLVANVHEIRIDTGDIQATDFSKRWTTRRLPG